MAEDVRIVKLDSVGGIFLWLCRACTKARRAKGSTVLEQRKNPFPRPCDDCEWRKKHPEAA